MVAFILHFSTKGDKMLHPELWIAVFVTSIIFTFTLWIKKTFFNSKTFAHIKAYEHSKDGVIILDKNYNIIDFNPAASLMIIHLDRSTIGKNARDVLKYYDNLLTSIIGHHETQLETKSGNSSNCYSVNSSIIYNKSNKINGIIVTLRDMTTYFEAMNKLNSLASYDELTSVHNRRCFVACSFEKLEFAKKHKHAISFIILDLDFFKYINDSYGHQAGDKTLVTVADICKKCIRSTDIIGRFGGEEFVILLPDTFTDEATIIANRICKDIEAYDIIFENNKIKTTASFGITGIDSVHNETLEMLFKYADKALYQAKAAGRNCTRVVPL